MDDKHIDMQHQAAYQEAITRNGEVPITAEKLGTVNDQRDMYRMGKIQRLRRNFSFFSIFGFSMVLLCTWEVQFGVATFGLSNGGTAGLIYVYIGTLIGMTAVVVSMAEMGSMAPTAGGQYHWVSEFAPKSTQRFLSYLVGWLCVLGWQTGSAFTGFLAGTEIQGLLVLNYPDTYTYQRWHGTLLVIAVVLLCGLFNTVLAHKLPLIEKCVLVLHVLGFLAIMIPLLVLAPRAPSHEIWTQFNDAGWGSTGLSCLVGVLAPVVSLVGSDAASHMSEELEDASRSLPRAMIMALVFNGVFGFGSLLTFVYCLGNVEEVLNTPTGYPFIQVFANGVGSIRGATAMVSIMIILSVFCCITNVASSSRQLFAFARDHGVPFSKFFATVHKGWEIPLNCVLVTMMFVILLSLINIGSTIAFNQITSLGVGALLSSYLISISCVALKRWRKEPLLPRSFDLGRWGFAINIFAILFLVLIFILCFFPPSPKPTPSSMNWSILMYGGVIIFALIWFVVKARKVYVGPVEYVRKDV